MAAKKSVCQHEHGMTGTVLECVVNKQRVPLQAVETRNAVVVFSECCSATVANVCNLIQNVDQAPRSGRGQMPTFLLYLKAELENISKIEVPEGGRFCINVSNSDRTRNSSSCCCWQAVGPLPVQ